MNVSDIKFTERLVAGKYSVLVPDFFNPSPEFWQTWEKERFDSMYDHLKPGMVLYDIGTCQGWEAAVLAGFVGAENMVLIEPLESNWALIKATWEANSLKPPKSSYCGFLSDRNISGSIIHHDVWPDMIDYTTVAPAEWEKQLGTTVEPLSLSLDWLQDIVGFPDALNIDVEGAELLVLQGAKYTLETFAPLVWLSIHTDLMRDRFDSDSSDVHEFMKSLGYTGTLLAEDHESHWFYEVKS